MKRESGFYWIRYDMSRWVVAEYLGRKWFVPGRDIFLTDDDFAEINETRLTPPAN